MLAHSLLEVTLTCVSWWGRGKGLERVPTAKPDTAQRPTLSGKSGDRWHHVMQNQTGAAKRGKRAKNTPAGNRPEEVGAGGPNG